MADVRLSSLRKEYNRGNIVAVEGLDLEIADGEFVTVVGPSGCGKTTTLRMIAGLEEPTDGTVLIGEEDVTDVGAKDRPIAMVFQNYALYPHKTVQGNMEFGLRMSTDLDASERTERVEEMAEMMGIEELLEDKPDELSGGQKQRVALGRAIVREPEVFLFDEPLSNLDAKLRTEMRAEIQKLQQEFGVTAVYVTHDQEEAMTMGDRLVILNHGELQQVGEPTEVYEHPVNKFVAGFIGSPSMNFIEVQLQRSGPTVTLQATDQELEVTLSPEFVDAHTEALEEDHYTLGVRPENVSLVTDGSSAVADSTVEVIEPVGSDNYVHLDLTAEFVARVDSGVKPSVGETVGLSFDESDIHLFHPETEKEVLADASEKRTLAAD